MQPVTHTSPYIRDEEAADYARDPFWQFEMVKQALYKFACTHGTGGFQDLRGQSFTVEVAEDGMSVTVTPIQIITETATETAGEASSEVSGG